MVLTATIFWKPRVPLTRAAHTIAIPPVANGSSSSYLPSTCPWEISPATGRGKGALGAVFTLDLEMFTDSGPGLKGSARSFSEIARGTGFRRGGLPPTGTKLCLLIGSAQPRARRRARNQRNLVVNGN